MQVESDNRIGTSDSVWQETRTATILFTDVAGFTRLSESLAPDVLVYNLNRYLDVLATTVYQSGGDVDKFLGDGMIVNSGIRSPQNRGRNVHFLLDEMSGAIL
jgi:adenylate cyclase